MAKKKIIRRNNRPLTYRMPSTSKPDQNTNQYSIGGFLSGLSGKVGGIMGGSKIAGSPMGDAISSIGGAAGQIGGSLIGGGLESGAGSAINNIGGTIGGAVGAVNPVLGGMISAGTGIIGGLTNKAFGSKMNQEKINEINASNTAVNQVQVDSSSNDSVSNQWASMDFGKDFSKGDIGSDGWFSSKAADKYKELKRQQEVARSRALQAFENGAEAADTNQDLNALKNFSAYGGPIEIATQAPMAPFGNRFAEGGNLHQKAVTYKNRLEAVRGPMNDDYDYTGYYMKYPKKAEAMIKGDKKAHFTDEFKLPNHATFSDESIYSKQRGGGTQEGGHWGYSNGHDTFNVSQDNFNNNPNLGQYFMQNEPNSIPIYNGGILLPQVTIQGNRFAEGGELDDLNNHGATWSNGVTYINNGGTHEQNPNEGVQMGVDDQGTPNLVEEGEVKWNNYIFSNRMTVNKPLLEKVYLPSALDNHTFAAAAESIGKESKERPNDPISQRGLNDSLTKLQAAQEVVKQKAQQRDMKKKQYAYGGNLFANGGYEMPFVKRADGTYPVDDNTGIGTYGKDWGPVGQHPYSLNPSKVPAQTDTWVPPFKAQPTRTEQSPYLSRPQETDTTKPPTNFQNSGLASLRFAPAIGSGVAVLSDALGWTNKPDYTNADRIQDSVNGIKPVTYTPVGNYLAYNPFDRNFYSNKLEAQAGATRRAIANQSGGNRANAVAGMLAADYNAQGKLGDLFRQAEEYNQGLRERAENFNRSTDQFNSEQSMKSQIANQATDRLRFEATAQAARLRDEVDSRSAANKNANLSNFFNNIGAVGQDSFSRNMVNSNPGLYYSIDSNGNITYKPKENKKACGGLLTIKKKGRRK